MSGSGQGVYGSGSGSSAYYGYGSDPYAAGPSSVPSTAGPYAGAPQAPFGSTAANGMQSPYGQPDPYAAYGAPQTIDPYAGAYPGPVVYSRPTSTMAILSLVFSLVGLITYGFTSIVGVILGHVARSQIKRTGEQGSGLALSGLIVGYSVIGLVVIVVAIYALLIGFAIAGA